MAKTKSASECITEAELNKLQLCLSFELRWRIIERAVSVPYGYILVFSGGTYAFFQAQMEGETWGDVILSPLQPPLSDLKTAGVITEEEYTILLAQRIANNNSPISTGTAYQGRTTPLEVYADPYKPAVAAELEE